MSGISPWIKPLYSISLSMFLFICTITILRQFNRARPYPQFNYTTDELEAAASLEKYIGSENELDGCFHVYLDVGSNVGIQVRKLFEPNLYPKATILAIYDKYFGKRGEGGQREETVCAVGFEPNPHHTKTLQGVQESYQSCGWRAYFYTETAAAHNYGQIEFLTDNDVKNREWGGSIVSEQRKKNGVSVGLATKIRLSDYILEKVITRKVPFPKSETNQPAVLMKIDIEGSELEVLTDLLVSGALQHISYTHAEFHSRMFSRAESRSKNIIELQRVLHWLSNVTQSLQLLSQINLDTFDDESYYQSTFPLPQC